MSRRDLVLALVAAAALAGCLGGDGAPEMSDEAKQLQNDSLAAMEDVERYRFSMTTGVSAPEGSVTVDADGVLDRDERRARLDMSVTGPQSFDMLLYIVNDTAYTHLRGTWRTQDVSDRNVWEQNAQLQQQREIVAASHLEITGETTIDGDSVEIVEMEVPEDKLDELTTLARQQSGSDSEASITDASYTMYVSTETDLLRKTEVDMTMEVRGQSMDGSVEMTFSDFGTDASITVPEEAKRDTSQRAAVAAPAP